MQFSHPILLLILSFSLNSAIAYNTASDVNTSGKQYFSTSLVQSDLGYFMPATYRRRDGDNPLPGLWVLDVSYDEDFDFCYVTSDDVELLWPDATVLGEVVFTNMETQEQSTILWPVKQDTMLWPQKVPFTTDGYGIETNGTSTTVRLHQLTVPNNVADKEVAQQMRGLGCERQANLLDSPQSI